MKKIIALTLSLCAIPLIAQNFAQKKALDFWDEGPRLFNTAAAGSDITPHALLQFRVESTSPNNRDFSFCGSELKNTDNYILWVN